MKYCHDCQEERTDVDREGVHEKCPECGEEIFNY